MEKRSFFERLTGGVHVDEHEMMPTDLNNDQLEVVEDDEGQLTLDMWQTQNEIVVQAMVAGVKPDDLDVDITNDMVTIRGKREKNRQASGDDYIYQELFWGAFSRSILLPQEVDSDEAVATMKGGLLTVKIPKMDKNKISKVKVKNE
jgi:HSP20 family protein